MIRSWDSFGGLNSNLQATNSTRGIGGMAEQSTGRGANPLAEAPTTVKQLGAKPRSRHLARLMLVMLVIVCLLALQSRGGAVEWLLTAVVCAAAVWCLIIPYAAIGSIQIVRTIKEEGSLSDGGTIQVEVTVKTTRPLPLMWISVHEELENNSASDGDGRASLQRRTLEIPWLRRSHSFSYSVSGLHRGEWRFRPLQISAGDLLGVSIRSFTIPAQGSVTVGAEAPQGEKLEGMPASMEGRSRSYERRPIDATGMTAKFARRRSGAGSQSRGYIPGDPLWRIDWRAMARGLGMQTRLHDNDAPSDIIVVLDGNLSSYGGDGRLFDANCGRAAQVIRRAFSAGSGITLLVTGHEETVLHIHVLDQRSLQAAEERLLRFQPSGRQPFFDQLGNIIARLPHGSAVICLTTAHSGGKRAVGGTVLTAGAVKGTGKSAHIQAAGGSSDMVHASSEASMNGGEQESSHRAAYAARLAAARRGKLHMLLACAGDTADSERLYMEELIKRGCRAVLLPLPAAYRRQPEILEGGDGYASVRI